ncbi:MAG: hypothetical protein ACR2QK_21260 [Acidimicrobiales bacterium]
MAADNSDALQAAARKRVELKDAVSGLETAAASASAEPGWRAQLIDRLEDLRSALDRHVTEVEAADGLLAELACIAPRLVGRIEETRAEHPVLCRQAGETIEAVAAGQEVDQARASVLELLLAVARHRQRGADLVYEGYEVDLGGS